MNPEEQQFLSDFDKKLWTVANKLLPMLGAAVDKHVVLRLIFLKYVSDAFRERRGELQALEKENHRLKGVLQSEEQAHSPAIRPAPTRVPAVAFAEG